MTDSNFRPTILSMVNLLLLYRLIKSEQTVFLGTVYQFLLTKFPSIQAKPKLAITIQGMRRYKLRLGGSGFYCQECYRLPYYSQQCGFTDGLIHQKHKLEYKLESGGGMRTYTRMQLIDQMCAFEDRIDNEFVRRFGSSTMREFGITAI